VEPTSNPTPTSAGVAILPSPNFSGSVQHFVFDSDGRNLSLSFVFNSLSKLNIVNVYPPNLVSDRKTNFEHLHKFVLSQGDYIIAGDFNWVDCAIDKSSPTSFRLQIKTKTTPKPLGLTVFLFLICY